MASLCFGLRLFLLGSAAATRSYLTPKVFPQHRTLLSNCTIWTGEPDSEGEGVARPSFVGSVLLKGNLVEAVQPMGSPSSAEADVIVDCGGRSVIPGLVEGHAHPSFAGIVAGTDIGDVPPEENLLITLQSCATLLDVGFTSAFSAASSKPRLDVVSRNWINAGNAPGPRLLAASPEICATGTLGDFSAMHQSRESFGLVADGVEEVRKAVRVSIREGVDVVKINIGGDLVPQSMLTEAKDDVMSTYTSEEVQAACEEAHGKQRRVAAHCRGKNDVKLALQHGVDMIYHLDFAYDDEEILRALEAAKDRIFVGPAVGLMDALAPTGHFKDSGFAGLEDVGVLLEAQSKTFRELRKRGLRIVIGGDYGFAVTPQGTNANDLFLFQKHFNHSAEEALVSATRIGGELMGMGAGQLKAGALADLLIVDGKPWEDWSVLKAEIASTGAVSAPGIVAVIQDGHFHRSALAKQTCHASSASSSPDAGAAPSCSSTPAA